MEVLARLRQAGGGRGSFIRRATLDRAPYERVLDVGCAWGWALADLRGVADELWGVDVDARALEQAQESYPFLRLRQVDGAELPFQDETFDLVLLTEVLEHIADSAKQAVVDEVFRVLRPGGTLVLTVPHAGALAWADPMDFKRRASTLYRLYMRLSGYRPDTPPEIGHRHLTVDELEKLLDGRFAIVELRLGGVLTPLIGWPLAVNARVRLLPEGIERALSRFRAWESGLRCPRALAENAWLVGTRLETEGASARDAG